MIGKIVLDFVQSPPFLALAVGGAILFTNYKYRASSVSNEVIGNYRTLREQLEEKIKVLGDALAAQATAHSGEMNKLHSQIGEKDGIIMMQNKIIDQQQATILNRNPNLEKVLGNIERFMEMIFTEMQESKEVSKANSDKLDKTAEILNTPKTFHLSRDVELLPTVPPAAQI